MSAARLKQPLSITHAANKKYIGIVFTAPRTSWALECLIENGENGLRTIDCSAMQLGYYIWCIRQKLGDESVITQMEKHGGPFSGEHARYILADQTIQVERLLDSPSKVNPATAATISQGSNPNTSNSELGGLSDG